MGGTVEKPCYRPACIPIILGPAVTCRRNGRKSHLLCLTMWVPMLSILKFGCLSECAVEGEMMHERQPCEKCASLVLVLPSAYFGT